MKRFKKVLALVLAGVMALALLTACGGTSDPDKIMPEDGTPEVVMTINNTAASKSLGQVEYSAKYSAITKELLVNWINYQNDGQKVASNYWAKYNEITAGLGNVKIVVGMTNDTIPAQSVYNPARKTSFKYDSIFSDTSTYELAEKIGVAFVTTSDGTVYQAVCLFDIR